VAGWTALRARGAGVDAVLVLAVDLPFVDEAVLRHLAEQPRAGASARVPRIGGRAQPLCARYDAAALAVATRLVTAGARSMHAWLDALDVEYLDEGSWAALGGVEVFADVDTADDAADAGLERPR
jgi:molybdopterin-guanine dinucleotide biosynthesis protein A